MEILGLAIVISGCTLYRDKLTRPVGVAFWTVGLMIIAWKVLV